MDLFKCMSGAFNAMATMDGDYENRKVGKDEVGSYTVSTAYTTDNGYETAVWVAGRSYDMKIVEYYDDKELATIGHQKWIEFCKTNPNFEEIENKDKYLFDDEYDD